MRSMRENWWSRADRAIGSFRRFLFVLLTRFLGQQHRLAFRRLELSSDTIDNADDRTPDRQFDLDFAACLASSALERLRADYVRDGRDPIFDALQQWLSETPSRGDLTRLGDVLGISPNTLAVQLKRLRLRFRKMVTESLEQLSADGREADNEVSALRHARLEPSA